MRDPPSSCKARRRAVTAGCVGRSCGGWCNRGASPEPRAAPRRSGHRHLLAMPRVLAQAMGMVGQPRGAPSRRVGLQTIPGGLRRGAPRSLEAGGPRRGGRAGDRPRLARRRMRRLEQKRSSCSIGYSHALSTGSRETATAKHRAVGDTPPKGGLRVCATQAVRCALSRSRRVLVTRRTAARARRAATGRPTRAACGTRGRSTRR